ncbi:AGE family epimerase/isomerase [Pleomorphovibrio marinus]|uniref:AGE family epimerase/isomerase n=1 Tax=Pleomorphovibrio marinus TaxID=2164132 RepID=UPI001300B8F5|nr:AGE family epimerase/isomerase [Pleomorphovibrio marinus]
MTRKLLFILFFQLCIGNLSAQQAPWMQSSYWKSQLFRDILPHWTSSIVDKENQSYHTSMDETWRPLPQDTVRYPSMIARHLFSYSAAFMLSGEREYMEMAARLKDYLLANAWDEQYGGWYNSLSPKGRIIDADKSSFVQLYAITGLTLYYLVTKDPEVLSYIEKSNALMESKAWDSTHMGYYDKMNRDWSVAVENKSFSPQLAPISGYLLYLYLASREESYLDQSLKILEMVEQKMVDPATGWVLEAFDREWNYSPSKTGPNEINIGHNIEVVWMLARVYLLNGKEEFMPLLRYLDRLNGSHGFDLENGFWYAEVGREEKELHTPFSYWWIQAYGIMADLVLAEAMQEKKYLERFEKAGEIWDTHFLDRANGDTHLTVGKNGEVLQGNKATQYKSSYHNGEHAFLNYLYLRCFQEKKPFHLFFYVQESGLEQPLYPLPIEAKGVSIKAVWIENEPADLKLIGNQGLAIPPISKKSLVKVEIQPE